MESVLAKLAQLMGDKCSNLIDLSSDTAFLRDELCTINALLKKLDHEDEDALDPQVKDWSNQVREFGYDIEVNLLSGLPVSMPGQVSSGGLLTSSVL